VARAGSRRGSERGEGAFALARAKWDRDKSVHYNMVYSYFEKERRVRPRNGDGWKNPSGVEIMARGAPEHPSVLARRLKSKVPTNTRSPRGKPLGGEYSRGTRARG